MSSIINLNCEGIKGSNEEYNHFRFKIIKDVCTYSNPSLISDILINLRITVDEVEKIKLFEYACSTGRLEIVKYIVNLYGIKSSYIKNINQIYISNLIRDGHFEVIKWLEDEYNILRNYNERDWKETIKDFPDCCANGTVEMVEWYVDTFTVTLEKFYTANYNCMDPLDSACSNGKKLTAIYLTEKFLMYDYEVFYNTAVKKKYLLNMCSSDEDRLELIMWYADRFHLSRYNLKSDMVILSILFCCNYNHLETAKWLSDQRFKITKKDIVDTFKDDEKQYRNTLIGACNNGSIGILKWILQTFSCVIDRNFIHSRIYDNIILGNIEVAEWLLKIFKFEDNKKLIESEWAKGNQKEVSQSELRSNIRKVISDPYIITEDIILESKQIVPTLRWFQKIYDYSFKDMFKSIELESDQSIIGAPRERFGDSVIVIQCDNASLFEAIFTSSTLEDIKWFIEEFNIKKADMYADEKRKKGTIIEPLSSAYQISSLKLVKWGVKYFNFNKEDILGSLMGSNAILESKNILIYLKKKYNIIKDDIMANKYSILRETLNYGGENYTSFIIFMEVFNISNEDLIEAIEISRKKGKEFGPELRYILMNIFGIIIPET